VPVRRRVRRTATILGVPSPSTWVVFVATSVGFALLPGPNVVFLFARSVRYGPWSAWRCALGVETATTVFALLAAAGLAQVIAASTMVFGLLKWAGVAYLCWLGISTLVRPDPQEAAPAGDLAGGVDRPRRGSEFASGFVLGISNPKVALFFIAFLPQFVSGDAPAAPQMAALGLVFAACGLACDMVWCAASGLLAGRVRANRKLQGSVRRATGAVYLALAGWAAVSGSHHKP
jgi:threonine/homoserine/homoserine lactone efflux protein